MFHRCLKGRANSAAEVAASLERLESPVPPLFPKERLWLLEIGYFIGVARAEELEQQSPAKRLFSALSLQAVGIQCQKKSWIESCKETSLL